MTFNTNENTKMSHALDYIDGFESLINEYKQDGKVSSPEAIYTNTVLKLNGFSSDSIVGSEGFISDVAKKFWQGILAIYNWFKSLFKSAEERKLDEAQKRFTDTIKKIKNADPNNEIIDSIVSEHYKTRLSTFINKLTFPLPVSETANKNPTPGSLLEYLVEKIAVISRDIKDSGVKEMESLLPELANLNTVIYQLQQTKFYLELDKHTNTSEEFDIMDLLPEAILKAIKVRRQCESVVKMGFTAISDHVDVLLNSELYKRYSKLIAMLIKNIVKIQNLLINESIYILKLVSVHPVFKGIDFSPLIDDKVKGLIVEDTVRDLA